MKRFAVYDSTGAILRFGICLDDDLNLQAGGGETAIEVADSVSDESHYIAAGVPAARTELGLSFDKLQITADDVDVATMAGVPAGTQFDVAGQQVTVNDGALEVTAALPGSYVVTVTSPQYRRQSWTIEAT